MTVKTKLAGLIGVAALALGTAVFAAESLQGTVSKVEEEGKYVIVKAADGKETKLRISSKRTKLEGVNDAAELKAGQKVTVTHADGEAQKLSVPAK